MHSNLKQENLELKKRLIETQMQLLEMQYKSIMAEIQEQKDGRKFDDIANQKLEQKSGEDK